MKKHRINKIFILLLIVVCTALGLTGCVVNGNVVGLSDYRYDDAEKYLVGKAELAKKVENIEIDWIVGSVKMLSNDSNTVSFSEESDSELTEDIQLRYWLDNTTLRIRFCACGKWDFSEMEKDLTVLVPDTLTFANLKVNSLSANVRLENVRTATAVVDTLSGNVDISDCGVTKSAKVNSLSGKVEAKFSEPLKEFKGDSTSGSFTVSAPSVSRFDVIAVSGAVSLSVQKEPDWLDIDVTSGNVSLNLPENASFALDYDTTSGDLSSDLSYRKSAGKYIFGDGKGEYEINTMSGDVRITTNNKENNEALER